MGKRIISQARGKGSLTYRAKKSSFIYKVGYPSSEGSAQILKLIHSAAHSAPLMKVQLNNEIFFIPAFNGAFVEQKIQVGGNKAEVGNILPLKEIPSGTEIYNIERNPGDGGKFMRVAGAAAVLDKKANNRVIVLLPNKKSVTLSENCRAVIGRIAGDGRLNKPFMTAGRKWFKMKAKNKLYPRTSAIKVNAVDHPFGSGRGKRAKPKIAKRNAPPGRRVGHLRPRRTGHKR